MVCATTIYLSQSFSLRTSAVAHHLFLGGSHFGNNKSRSTLFRVSLSTSRLHNSLTNDVDSTSTDRELMASLRSMRAKDIKLELEALNVSTQNALEKEELVQRLYKVRIGKKSGGNNSVESKKKKKKRRTYDYEGDDNTILEETESIEDGSSSTYNAIPSNTDPANGWTITTPLIYHELESSKSVAAQNAENTYIRPSQGKYAAIKVQLKKNDKSIEWTLLVDTACSGLVLSPNAVTRVNQQHPGMIQLSNGGATMTMAGSSQRASVATWDASTKMNVEGLEINHSNMAACQDIGALPAGLDGILGLSFLDKFACVDFDFVSNELRLHRTDPNPLIPNMKDIVAQGTLSLTKLRIYTADVTLDGRGPVKLLVDTGAASSFLNWKGVSDMKLSSSSPQIDPIRDQIGAMGADNMALKLTHRFKLKRRWNVVAENNAGGNFCPGIALQDNQFSDVDIADLPVLETLKEDGVGGILGADLLMMCDVMRFSGLDGARTPTMILMKQ